MPRVIARPKHLPFEGDGSRRTTSYQVFALTTPDADSLVISYQDRETDRIVKDPPKVITQSSASERPDLLPVLVRLFPY